MVWLHNGKSMSYRCCGKDELWQNRNTLGPPQVQQKKNRLDFVTAVTSYISYSSIHQEWLELQRGAWTCMDSSSSRTDLSPPDFHTTSLLWPFLHFKCGLEGDLADAKKQVRGEIECRIPLKLMGPFADRPFAPGVLFHQLSTNCCTPLIDAGWVAICP